MAGYQRRGPFQTFSRTANSGAAKGLEEKMKYWKDRDFRTEFSITLGQARNNIIRTGDVDKDMDILLEEFKFMLLAKNDARFHTPFQEFYREAKSFQGIEMEPEAQSMENPFPPSDVPVIVMDEGEVTHRGTMPGTPGTPIID